MSLINVIGSAARRRVAEFDPLTAGTLRWWIDAQDASTITSLGGNLTAIADKSGNGFTGTATGTVPLTSEINGRQTIQFVTDSRLTLPTLTFASGSGTTCIQVAKITNLRGVFAGITGGTTNHFFVITTATSLPFIRWSAAATDLLRPASGAAIALNANLILTWRVTPSGVAQLRVNGVLTHSSTHAETSGGATFSQWGYQVGGRQAERHEGEVLWYQGGLDIATIIAAENWLAAKWGIAI